MDTTLLYLEDAALLDMAKLDTALEPNGPEESFFPNTTGTQKKIVYCWQKKKQRRMMA